MSTRRESAEPELPSTAKKFIVTIVLLGYWISGVAGNLNRTVDKCCPQGYVLSDYQRCTLVEDSHPQIYRLRGRSAVANLSECPNEDDVTFAMYDDLDEPTFEAEIACIDLIDDGDEDTSDLVILRCATNRSSEESARKTESYAVPRLPIVRMCCGAYQAYDAKKRDCVFKEDGPNVPKNFRFLNENRDFVIVIRSEPECQSAIVDYAVNVKDIRIVEFDDVEVVLTTKNGSKTVVVARESTCFDPGTSGEPDVIVVRACPEEDFCEKNPCVRKCCAENEAMIDNECGNIPPGVPPGYFHEMLRDVSLKRGMDRGMDALKSSDYGMLIGKKCENMSVSVEGKDWHITPEGNIDVADDKIYGIDDYCVEMFFGDRSLEDGIYPLFCKRDTESS